MESIFKINTFLIETEKELISECRKKELIFKPAGVDTNSSDFSNQQ